MGRRTGKIAPIGRSRTHDRSAECHPPGPSRLAINLQTCELPKRAQPNPANEKAAHYNYVASRADSAGFGGVLDGRIERAMVFTIPVAAGFPSIESVFNEFVSAHPGDE
jgi:hypothetical protein